MNILKSGKSWLQDKTTKLKEKFFQKNEKAQESSQKLTKEEIAKIVAGSAARSVDPSVTFRHLMMAIANARGLRGYARRQFRKNFRAKYGYRDIPFLYQNLNLIATGRAA